MTDARDGCHVDGDRAVRMPETSRFETKNEDKKTKRGRRKRRGVEDEIEEDKTNGRK